MSTTDEKRTFGYRIEDEDIDSLMSRGRKAEDVLLMFKYKVPKWNQYAPPDMVNILDQGQVGSCQGQSLAKMFQICYFLATGRVLNFSAMAGYILAQRHDGLIGRDVGSTLSGGQRAAADGICLEKDWPYTGRYDSRIPNVPRPFKLVASKPTNDPDLISEALDAGLPVQTGMTWNHELDRDLVTNYTGRGAQGGHATTLWQKKSNGNWINHNSWGSGWAGDGRSEWTPQAARQIITYRTNTFVIYSPEMEFPDLEIINPQR